MKTSNVNSPVFTGKSIVAANYMSKELKTAVETSPAIKRFGKFYKANIASQDYLNDGGVPQKGLMFYDIKPRNMFTKMFEFLTGNSTRYKKTLLYNSGKTTEEGLIKDIKSKKKNDFLRYI